MSNSFIVRLKTWDEKTDGLVSRISEGLKDNDLILGWSLAQGLIGEEASDKFKRKLAEAYPDLAVNNHKLGSAAGSLWRFIQDMKKGDFAVVPDAGQFYVAKVTDEARYDKSHLNDDTAHRRRVEWLNGGQPLPRELASSGLQSRMKVYQTTAWADEFTEEIKKLLAADKAAPRVGDEIAQSMRDALLQQLRQGRMNDRSFEKFIAALMRQIGCSEVKVIARRNDKGVDIRAFHDALGVPIAVQVKWHNDPHFPTDRECIDQLEKGMETGDIGWAVTLGKFGPDAEKRAEQLRTNENLLIRLIDGDELAKLAIEHGIPLQF
jgi:predicted Mrr-cat superfamily restriction endonuclease